ncbi:MAG: hypothetical protein FWF63_07265 [Fibromonadales bacterium]|nr:hypothetical protein [Fibromonadales bacterium]
MDEINELYETLGIAYRCSDEDSSAAYDTRTPYKKCGVTINVPITAGNSSVTFVPNVVR